MTADAENEAPMVDYDPISAAIARECAIGVRGCCTDEQYRYLVERITRAIQAERCDGKTSHAMLSQAKCANDLKEREVRALEQIAKQRRAKEEWSDDR